ncbi:MAG: arginine--tRNA ligase [Candidatus Amoebophilus sp. 36-38]|nr:MAG: arginine--tRNA ligase [Candidatus Amoebophilus sp. 36-38]
MNIDILLREGIQQAFQSLFNIALALEDIELQSTRKEFEGTHTFVCFPFAAACKLSPEGVANEIGNWLQHHTDWLARFNVVKGFLNLMLKDTIWLEQFNQMYQTEKFCYFPSNGQKIVVEFSSPNTNKPLHLGHLRNNFLGYAVSQILQAVGYEVYQVNLINDRGIHICKSMVAYQHWGRGETPESTGLKGDQLVGKYYVKFDQVYKEQVAALTQTLGDAEQAAKQAPLLQEVQAMLKNWEAGDMEVLALWEKMNSWVYEGFQSTYQKLNITFDKVYYESQTYLLGKEVIAEGLAKGVFYKKSDGSVWIDLTQEGLDEKLLLRSDGTAVYITQDMGTADLRYQDFKPHKLVYVVGNEQDYHFEVLTKIMQRLGRPYATDMYHLSYGMVDLPTGKMKSREGTVVDADMLIEEMVETAEKHTKELGKIDEFSEIEAKELYQVLGMGALRYFLLRVDAKKRLLFDPRASIDFQGDTGPFIQYTHARIAAVLRKAEQANINFKSTEIAKNIDLHPLERELIVQLATFPEKLKESAMSYAPAIVAQHALEISKAYNRMYAELSMLHEPDIKLKLFRLQLSTLVASVIRTMMHLLGIVVPDRM